MEKLLKVKQILSHCSDCLYHTKFGIHKNKIRISQDTIIKLTGDTMSWDDEPVEI